MSIIIRIWISSCIIMICTTGMIEKDRRFLWENMRLLQESTHLLWRLRWEKGLFLPELNGIRILWS